MNNITEVYYIGDDTNIAQAVKEYFEQLNFKVTIFSMIADVKRALLKNTVIP